ncbi:NADH:flavin oxidoreductase/NADH oxidase [Natronosalvus halobius]|uniref:NADH:flavin oxidoreductase/NADH oxidase n=1 Tax=Natronosalvus halobius TaxID=2953746 RepID=UPI00209FCA9C|nr:NADH:flavin oxidoreductase/NADH oxidase [Natronosalvus halobius]USZ73676.1 NADH:flavin oxidoreductase/NADH oxidase [Natronosalvus halobius]
MDSHLFSSIDLGDISIPNRLVVSPMCQYSVSEHDGIPRDWHLVHLGSRAVGGAGVVMAEATAVEPDGRISPADTGIWSDAHATAWKRITDFIKSQNSVPGIQLSHAGRKASTSVPWEADGARPVQPEDGGWEVVAPSDIPWTPYGDSPPLHVLETDEIEDIIDHFATAASLAADGGFEIAEIHAAHGYLLHEFLSPVSNTRDDEYGGSFDNRTRIVCEIVSAVRDVWEKPLWLRISASDWLDDRDSWTVDDSIRLAQKLGPLGVDVIDVSSGGIHLDQDQPHTGPNNQVPLAEAIRDEADVGVCAVGGVKTPEQADALIRNNRADFVAVARQFLREPYLGLNAARKLNQRDSVYWPPQYERSIRE